MPFLVGAFVLGAWKPCLAQEAPSGSILIRDVRVLSVGGSGEDAAVTILIKDGVVDLVTKDEVPITEAALALDARGGFLLGKLRIGEAPSFLILESDPRDDVQVLLDTNRHAVFAIHQGEILRNSLQRASATGEEPKRSGWLGYTPPPLALPLSYADATKWNRWETRPTSGIFIGVLALDRQLWPSQDEASEEQVGGLDAYEGGEIRALRFGSVGTLNFKRPWVYTIFLVTRAFDQGFDSTKDDSLALYDLRLDIPLGRGVTLGVGKQKEPISMERLTSMIYLPMQERSAAADALLPARNVGAVLFGTAADQRMTWAGGIFNTALGHGESPSDGSTQFVGRFTALPFITADESNLVHLGLGLRYSDLTDGARGLTEPEFDNAPLYVDTGFVEAQSTTTYVLEASWRKGPYWLESEFLRTNVELPSGERSQLGGYHVTASWVLTGEMRPYRRRSGIVDRIPVARSVNQRGWGAVELGVRWSVLDLTDGVIDGGEMEILSLGVNWFLSPFLSLGVNVRDIDLDRFGLEGSSRGVAIRLVASLE